MQMRPRVVDGLYANHVDVRASLDEVNSYFSNVDFIANSGAVVARIAMPYRAMIELMDSLIVRYRAYSDLITERTIDRGLDDVGPSGADP